MIPVRNVYYMLAYAFRSLQSRGWAAVSSEEFENCADLCAAILCRGMSDQLRRGLWREYVPREEELATVRGRIDVTASVKARSIMRRRLVCEYDEFSVDSELNRVIKTTLVVLLRSADLPLSRKREIRNILAYLTDVVEVDIHGVNWAFRYDRNSQDYRMLVGVCWLVAKGLLQTQTDGSTRVLDVFDEQHMSRLYERFILGYYRSKHRELSASASQIPWALDDGFGDLLPTMRSDISLSRGGTVLIIDAKYYELSGNTQNYYGTRSIHSANLYQIFTYVKNREAGFGAAQHEVSGMLLYARTDEDVQPEGTYCMSGNRIEVRTLDLGQKFERIASQLDAIAASYFGKPLSLQD